MSKQPIDRGGLALGKAVRAAYADGQADYSMEPLLRVNADGKPIGKIQEGDAVIFCCRRGEREIELTEAFTDPDFKGFERPLIKDLDFVILTMYHEKFKHLPIAFAPAKVPRPLAEIISDAGRTQMHCAESEKFAHVTFFFNGGEQQPFKGETDVRIPSPKGVPFDTVPELSLPKVADAVIDGIGRQEHFILVNFANGDVIGHTSNNAAKVECAQHVDKHLGRVMDAALKAGYVVAVTADHGNLEVMVTGDGKPHVAHTSNPVPFLIVDPASKRPLHPIDGSLCDVSPTVLQVLGIRQPAEMQGRSLVPDHDFGYHRKMLLVILDGWGIGPVDAANPIHLARTPNWDTYNTVYHPSRLKASGEAAGLQAGKAGNSEAGHSNLGAGRVVLQDDVRLNNAMQDGSFSKNEVFLRTIEHVKQRGKRLHLLALLTKKSSHGSIDYPLALLKMAKDLPEIDVHVIFDGRSTEPGSAPALLADFEAMMNEIGAGQIVDGVGRGIALDRDGNYPKVQKAYDMLVSGKGREYR